MFNIGMKPHFFTHIILWLVAAIASARLLGAAQEQTKNSEPEPSPSLAVEFAKAFKDPASGNPFVISSRIDQQLDQAGESADNAAQELLAIKTEFVTNRAVLELIDKIAEKGRAPLAAKLLIQIACARVPRQTREPPIVVVGQLVVEDGQTDPTLVLAQMPILEEGYFAGPIGTLDKPITFRSHGYEDLDVPLKDKDEGIVYVGQATLKPVAKERQASLKGKIVLDGASKFDSVTIMVSATVGPLNTINGGYSGRKSWPEGIKVAVSESGTFEVDGLNPSEYAIFATAKGHIEQYKKLKLTTGQQLEVDTLRMMSSDFGFYIGKPAPTTQALTWEPDFDAALKRAETEKRPMLVMLTATWCGPCKLLEEQTLNDPWIRYFLSPFVMVKAYEDRDVEKRLGAGSGYPTLVFTDSTGKGVYNSMGHMPPHLFAVHCVQALKATSMPLPPEIETLIDQKVIKLP